MPDLVQPATDPTPSSETPTPPTPGTKAALQLELDAALARCAALESQLGTVTVDRDAAAEQLADAARQITALQEITALQQPPREEPVERVLEALHDIGRSMEAQACLAAASVAQHEGRGGLAQELRDRALRCLLG